MVEVPEGWIGYECDKFAGILPPGTDLGTVGTRLFAGTAQGEFSVARLPYTLLDLTAVARERWCRSVHARASDCEVIIDANHQVHFERTDGVSDIDTWVVRPAACPTLLLEVQYSALTRPGSQFDTKARRTLNRWLIQSIR